MFKFWNECNISSKLIYLAYLMRKIYYSFGVYKIALRGIIEDNERYSSHSKMC